MEKILLSHDFVKTVKPLVLQSLKVATLRYNDTFNVLDDSVLSYVTEILRAMTNLKEFQFDDNLNILCSQLSYVLSLVIDCKEKNPKNYSEKMGMCENYLEDFLVTMKLSLDTKKIDWFPYVKSKDYEVYACVYNKELEIYQVQKRIK